MSLSRTLRLVASVLALVGLLARPARAVVVCPMEMPVLVEQADASEHAHHAEQTAEAPADEPVDESGDAPAHEVCPDLAHCAVAAPASASELTAADDRVRAARVVAAQDRPTSAIASLEPPPPKRS